MSSSGPVGMATGPDSSFGSFPGPRPEPRTPASVTGSIAESRMLEVEAADLVRIADSLDATARPGTRDTAVMLRHAAGHLLDYADLLARTASERVDHGPGRCRGCGADLEQPRTGRPRLWCGRGSNRGRCAQTRAKHTMAA